MPTQQILTDLLTRISIRREEHRVLVERLNELESTKTQILLGKELYSVEFVIKFKDSNQVPYWHVSDTKNMVGTVNQTLTDEIEIIEDKLIALNVTIQKDLEEYARKLNEEFS